MELSLKDFKELFNGNYEREDHPYAIGGNYLIRTVTMIYTGKLIRIYDKELVLAQAAWIPETERWNISTRDVVFKEVEMYPADKEVIINRSAITDCVEIPRLPTESN